MAFLPCVGFCDYDVMRQVGSGVDCPLSGRYAVFWVIKNQHFQLALEFALLSCFDSNLTFGNI